MPRFTEVLPRTSCVSLSTYLEILMFGHEWMFELYVSEYLRCDQSHGLRIAISSRYHVFTYPQYQVAWVTEFCMVVPSICGLSV
jgi:hypothetical protein